MNSTEHGVAHPLNSTVIPKALNIIKPEFRRVDFIRYLQLHNRTPQNCSTISVAEANLHKLGFHRPVEWPENFEGRFSFANGDERSNVDHLAVNERADGPSRHSFSNLLRNVNQNR